MLEQIKKELTSQGVFNEELSETIKSQYPIAKLGYIPTTGSDASRYILI